MFDPPPSIPKGVLRARGDKAWQHKVAAVMKRFQQTFPEIVYDIAWDVDALNGVAWRQMSQAHVRLYGLLLRHRAIRLEGVALLFAHETGHHRGGPPRDKTYTWMTTERQADFWAARFGVRAVWANDSAEAKRQVIEGARQLLALETNVIELDEAGCRSAQLSHENRDHPLPTERFRIFMDALS